MQDALGALMAGMAQYGETHALSDTEQPLFAAAAQSAIKARVTHAAQPCFSLRPEVADCQDRRRILRDLPCQRRTLRVR